MLTCLMGQNELTYPTGKYVLTYLMGKDVLIYPVGPVVRADVSDGDKRW